MLKNSSRLHICQGYVFPLKYGLLYDVRCNANLPFIPLVRPFAGVVVSTIDTGRDNFGVLIGVATKPQEEIEGLAVDKVQPVRVHHERLVRNDEQVIAERKRVTSRD